MIPARLALRPSSSVASFVVALALLVNPTVPRVTAQESGTGALSGQVSNQSTGAYLEGARVVLEPLNRIAFTSRDGTFSFAQLPAGSYRLNVSYTGLDPQQVAVEVRGGQRVMRDIGLSAEIYQMSEFTVTGEREGSALAVTLQRNALNVKNVISADTFGNIADGNIGNFLQRTPGVSVQDDEGEIYRVMVRGIDPDLNSITIDGSRIANATNRGQPARSLSRSVEIDKLPADFIETIEITKAMTPDMEADSIGGSINLKTKSALDRKERVISYMAGASYNVNRDTYRPIGSVMYSDILGSQRNLGLLLTSSFNRTHKPRDSAGVLYEPTTDTSRPEWFYIDFVGEDQLQHQRTGIGLSADYKHNEAHRFSFSSMYSEYKDDLNRRRVVMQGVNAQRIRPGWTATTTETFNHTFRHLVQTRDRQNETFNYRLGGESRLFGATLDYSATYSISDGSDRRERVDLDVPGVGFLIDRSRSREYPTFVQTSGPDITVVENGRISQVSVTDQLVRDEIWGGQLNLHKQFDVAVPASLKTGVRHRHQKRRLDQEAEQYSSYVGPDGVAGRNAASGINDDNLANFIDRGYNYRPLDGLYSGWSFVDKSLVFQDLRQNPQHYVRNTLVSTRDDLQNDASAKEDVFAAYVMGDLKLGRLTVLGGLRMEETRVSGIGVVQEITPEERARRAAWVGPVTDAETARRVAAEFGNRRRNSGDYRDVFPSVHFKYEITPGLQGRASYSTGIGRPNFSDILPITSVNHDLSQVVSNNINLKPQYSDNFDASLEYYFEPAGLLSFGVFLKEIGKFIYTDSGGRIPAGDDNGFGGQYEGYELRSNFNGGFARVRGWEAAYQQQFSNLPGFWRGFGAFANYTYTDAKGNYGQPGTVRTSAELELFTPRTYNVGISYIARGVTVRVKMNYRAATLFQYNADPARRRYNISSRPVDVNLKYDLNRRLSFFADIINLFDVPTGDRYDYIASRPIRSEKFTTAVKFGISGRY